MADAVSKQAFAAAIFKRGQKAELFDDGGGGDEEAELSSKLSELHGVWSLERIGYILRGWQLAVACCWGNVGS